jgi:hypothetical protein
MPPFGPRTGAPHWQQIGPAQTAVSARRGFHTLNFTVRSTATPVRADVDSEDEDLQDAWLDRRNRQVCTTRSQAVV